MKTDLIETLHFLRARREDLRRQLSRYETLYTATQRAIAVFHATRLGEPDPLPELDRLERAHAAKHAETARGIRQSLGDVNRQITSILNQLCRSHDDSFPATNKSSEEKLMKQIDDDWWEVQGKPALQSMFGD